MKEATGELSTTVIAVVAIAAVAAIFTAILLPSLRAQLRARTYCSAAYDCTPCEDGKRTCHYYEEADDGTMAESEETIVCDCDEEE